MFVHIEHGATAGGMKTIDGIAIELDIVSYFFNVFLANLKQQRFAVFVLYMLSEIYRSKEQFFAVRVASYGYGDSAISVHCTQLAEPFKLHYAGLDGCVG